MKIGEEKQEVWQILNQQPLLYSAIMASISLINIVIDIWVTAEPTAIAMSILMTVISQHFGTYELGCYCFNGP